MTRRIDRALDEGGFPPLERSAWVEVDVDILVGNASALASLAAPAALGAVVKADGYGHGLEMAARCAVTGGACWLCVADSGEAVRLRDDGYQGRIFVLYPVPAAIIPLMSRLEIDVTVAGATEAISMAGLPARGAPTLAVHLEIDTGMTRGGVSPDEAVATATAIAGGAATRLAGVWTHLAAPEVPDTTRRQLELFQSTVESLVDAGIDPGAVHAAASGGILATDTRAHTFVRPGLAVYGLDPRVGPPLPPSIAPALAVRAHPVRIVEVPAGTAVGYAGTWVADRVSRIATLPIGYADGWSRSSSPGTFALVEDRRAPLVGRVSSDSLTVDVTDVTGVGPESVFTLLGRVTDDDIGADEIADVRGTISWEVLQQLGSRLSRVYTSELSPIAVRRESTKEIVTGPGATIPGY